MTFYDDIRDSFILALESEGVDPEVITRVVDTVDDYVDNHYEPERKSVASDSRA